MRQYLSGKSAWRAAAIFLIIGATAVAVVTWPREKVSLKFLRWGGPDENYFVVSVENGTDRQVCVWDYARVSDSKGMQLKGLVHIRKDGEVEAIPFENSRPIVPHGSQELCIAVAGDPSAPFPIWLFTPSTFQVRVVPWTIILVLGGGDWNLANCCASARMGSRTLMTASDPSGPAAEVDG